MQSKSRSSLAGTAIVCGVLLGVFAGLSWAAVRRECATFDEGYHLMSAWIVSGWGDYRCDPEDPPLWKYWAAAGGKRPPIDLTTPAAAAQLAMPSRATTFINDVLYAPGNDVNALLGVARARMLILGVFLGAAIAFWGWRLGGGVAAIVATALFCFDPNFTAHAPLLKNDIAISLAMLAGAYTIWCNGNRIGWMNSAGVGVCLGAGLATKFSGVLFIPMFAAMLFGRAILPMPWPAMGRVLLTRGRRLLAAAGVFVFALLLGWGVLWLCYGFRFAASPEGADFDAASSVAGIEANAHKIAQATAGVQSSPDTVPDLKWRALLFADRHHLLPQSWVAGFLYTYRHSMARNAFLFGQRAYMGWWYYFPLAMAFKTPLATLGAVVVSVAEVIALLRSRTKRMSGESSAVWTALCLGVPLSLYLLAAMTAHLNLGLRHVLPIYPYIYIAIGLAAARAWRAVPRATLVMALVLALGLIMENVLAFPDYISFFNAAVGGSRGGLALLSDSNLDWGQNLPELAAWQRANTDCDLMLSYFGSADPRYYGIRYINLPGSGAPMDMTERTHKKTVIAISATNLQGTYQDGQQRKFYLDFLDRKPLAVLGGTIYLFDVNTQ